MSVRLPHPHPPFPGRLSIALFAAALVFGNACSLPAEEPLDGLAQARRSINDGILEPGEPGVVLLYHQWYGAMCTGTLIGSRVVLTAKHCVQNESGQMYSTGGWTVNVGSSMHAISHSYDVDDVRTTPGASIEDSDVAVMILSQPAQENPYRFKIELDTPSLVGRTGLLIGYGQDGCPDGDSGTKFKTVDDVVGWATINDFVLDGNGANHGDSGGPVFDPDTMEVMGVISRGGDCQEYPGLTVAVRVDAWKSLINEALTDTGDCAPTSLEESCDDGVDNNCNGEVDEGCAPEGAACAGDEDCASRYCRDVGTQGSICTSPCDPFFAASDCASGSYCLRLGCDEGACAPGSPGPLAVGEPCQADTDCQQLLCADPGTGAAVCMAFCGVDAGQCLGNEACVPLEAGAACGGCVPDRLLPGPFGLGERCEDEADCVAGQCLDDGGLGYCTFECQGESDCPAGFHCRDARCVRGPRGHVGDPCVNDQDCDPELQCLGAGVQPGYCTASCAGGESCPTGTSCDGQACVLDGLPLGNGCVSAGDCHTRGCFSFQGENACTLTCDRQTPCPPLMTCVMADNGMTLCQPHRLPVTDDPGEQPTNPGDCATGGPGGAPLLLTLAGLAWLWRRRRRRAGVPARPR